MKPHFLLLAGLILPPASLAAPQQGVTAPIRQFLGGFNTGDTKSAYAAFSGNIVIIDEFPPHLWIGPQAPQHWAADCTSNAQKTGVTGGAVTYGKPTRTEIEAQTAYVIVPTVYTYRNHSIAMTENGQMTFALHATAKGWKIQAWTWTDQHPNPVK